jgi:hypothetical protein
MVPRYWHLWLSDTCYASCGMNVNPVEPTPAVTRGEVDRPFDPRTEVSADARHVADKIVNHLWYIFVLLPIISVILSAMVYMVYLQQHR